MADDNSLPNVKNILQSKTFWTNLLGPLFLYAATRWGVNLDANTQTVVIFLIMSAANIGLRFLTTRPVSLTKASTPA